MGGWAMPLILSFKRESEELVRKDDVNGLPSYTCSFSQVYHDGADWIVSGIGRSVGSSALHPNTVYKHEWCPAGISIAHTGTSSPDSPACLENDLGVDLFFRFCRLSHPVWYRSPSGLVSHSGAKRMNNVLGKRWCHRCQSDLSANNYVSQHMRLTHAPELFIDTEWKLFCKFIRDACKPHGRALCV